MNKLFWFWVLVAVVVLNGLVFGVGLYRGGVLFGPVGEVALASGLRADLVQVERPWETPVDQQSVPPQDASEAVAPVDSNQTTEAEPLESEPTLAQLQQGQFELNAALEKAEQKVKEEVPEPEQCLRWGPLLADQVQRVEDSLQGWTGRWVRSQKREPIGYIVYLPKEQVDQGLGLPELTALGVQETFYMAQPGPLQGAISLGLFRDEERARVHQTDMLRQGVAGVEVQPRQGPARTFIELYGVQAQIDDLRAIYALNRRSTLSECPESTVTTDGLSQNAESPTVIRNRPAQSPDSTPSL